MYNIKYTRMSYNKKKKEKIQNVEPILSYYYRYFVER